MAGPTFNSSVNAASSAAAAKIDSQGTGIGVVASLTVLRGFSEKGVFSANGDNALVFPALLNDFTYTEATNHQDFSTVSGGEFSQVALGDDDAHQLRRGTLSTLAMEINVARRADLPFWYSGAAPLHWSIVRDTVQDILRSKQPVYLYAAIQKTGRAELSMPVTLRNLSFSTRNGTPQARFLDVDFTEYRVFGVDRAKVGYASAFPVKHRVAAGDTWTKLAQTYYGSASKWRSIVRENATSQYIMVSTMDVTKMGFKVGQTITIPAPPSTKAVKVTKKKK